MCQIWLRSDGRVEKRVGVQTDIQTDRQRDPAALYSRQHAMMLSQIPCFNPLLNNLILFNLISSAIVYDLVMIYLFYVDVYTT